MEEKKKLNGHKNEEIEKQTEENDKKEEKKLSRFERRQIDAANEHLKILKNQFIQDKNATVAEYQGHIFIDKNLKNVYRSLNSQWILYCKKAIINRKRSMLFNYDAFELAIKKHMHSHSKLVWINHVMKLIKNIYEIELKFNNAVEVKQPGFKIKNIKRMHTLEIPDVKYFNRFPSEIEEMNQEQFTNFCKLTYEYMNEEITVEEFKTHLFLALCDVVVPNAYSTYNDIRKIQINEKICMLADLMDSFFIEKFEKGVITRELNLYFIKNMLPKLDKYFGPSDALTDITFCEYRMANMYYRMFITNKDEDSLNRMIAILWRPKKSFLWLRKMFNSYDGHERIAYSNKSNPMMIEKRVMRIAKLPFYQRYGAFLFMAGCERYLREGKPTIDGNEIDFSILYSNNVSEKDASIGLTGLLYSLAESKVFGNLEETDDQNLYDVMLRLYQVVSENNKRKEEIKDDKNKQS